MLEILMLFLIGRHIASIAKRKNRNPTGYVLMFIFGYIGAAITCAITGGVIASAADVREDDLLPFFILGYFVGIVGAISFSYLVVCSVSPLAKRRRVGDYDDYDDRPRRRRDYDEE